MGRTPLKLVCVVAIVSWLKCMVLYVHVLSFCHNLQLKRKTFTQLLLQYPRRPDKSAKHQMPLPARSTYFYVLYKTRAKQRDSKHATSSLSQLKILHEIEGAKSLSWNLPSRINSLDSSSIFGWHPGQGRVLASPHQISSLRTAPIWCWTHLDTRKPPLQVDKTGLGHV